MKTRICIGLAVLATALMYPAAAWAAVTFAPATDYSVDSSGPINLAVGDLNGDGTSDVVTANYNSGNLSVLLGNGDGTLAAATILSVGANPGTVVIGDLNGDADPDLVANSNDSSLSVLLGNGDGTFAAATTAAAGGTVNSLAIGDLNGDGASDIVTANLPDSELSVLLGNGDGTFAPAVDFPAGAQAFMVTITDVNGDNKSDAITSYTSGSSVGILLGNGDGTLAAATLIPVGGFPAKVVVSDFNDDGKPDLAAPNTGGPNVSVLLGNGDGTFAAPTAHATGPQPNSVAVGDFNSDGKPDLAAPSAIGNFVSVLLGNGDGTFASSPALLTGSAPFSVGVGDINGDGAQDITTGNFGANTVSVLLNTSEFPFTTGPTASISGTARQGQTLTADGGSPDPTPDSFEYQWHAGGVDIGGANAKTFTLTSAQVGKQVTVTVTAKKAGLTDASDTSAPTSKVAGIFTPGPKASITGYARIGSVLIARPGSPSPAPTSVVYRWYANGKLIPGATARYIRLTTAHYNKRIQVKVWAVKAGYVTASNLSPATARVNNLQAKVLSMELNAYSVRRGQRVYAEIDRLAPGEPFSIVLDGTKLASGKANTRGEAVVGFTIPVKATVGARILRAYGMYPDRTDPDRITIR